MTKTTQNVPVSLDDPTKELLDQFAEDFQFSRSAVMRLALREYFEKRHYAMELPHPADAAPVPVVMVQAVQDER